MSKIKLFLILIVAAAIVAVGIWFSAENSLLIQPKLFGFTLWQANLGFWLFSVFLLGGLLGFFISWLSYIGVKSHSKSLERKLSKKEHEVAQLRSAVLKD